MRYVLAALIAFLAPFSGHANLEQSSTVSQITGAKTWETHIDGVFFSLTQILPDQLRAFYVNRGFTLEQIEPYVLSCVYMAVLRNDNAPGEIHFISNNWVVLVNNKTHQLKPVREWLHRLNELGAQKPAVIAFRWAQFPPEQEYKPGGDWNQGMLSIGLPAAAEFNIAAGWDIAGKEFQAKLSGVQCAK